MNIIQRRSTDYIKEITTKKLLVLHFTAGGNLAGSEATLAKPDQINVHFQIDRDGQIYQYFDEKYWAYATGKGATHDRGTLNIEFVCWGPLTRKGDRLYSWTNTKIAWDEAIHLTPWRGYEYWHYLTEAQEKSAQLIVPYLQGHWPGLEVTTHARLNPRKYDFPPDYPTIKDLVTR